MTTIFDSLPASNVSAKSLYLEVPVNPEASPFLVSSPDGYIWVESASKGFVRVGLQKDEGVLDILVVKAIIQRSMLSDWGNSIALDQAGYGKAIDYLATYGYSSDELCVLSSTPLPFEAVTTHADWLPDGIVVVMPSDRSYFGWKSDLGSGRRASLVHNASRGFVVLLSEDQLVNFRGNTIPHLVAESSEGSPTGS